MKIVQPCLTFCSCLTLCDPLHYTVHGILQAWILEWVAFPFSRGSSQPRFWTQVSSIAGRFFTSWAGIPGTLKWVACPFSRGSSLQRNWIGVSCIAGGFFTYLFGQGSPNVRIIKVHVHDKESRLLATLFSHGKIRNYSGTCIIYTRYHTYTIPFILHIGAIQQKLL